MHLMLTVKHKESIRRKYFSLLWKNQTALGKIGVDNAWWVGIVNLRFKETGAGIEPAHAWVSTQ